MDPRLSWLTSFVAVAEELHFGKAADRVGHSASAVSRHVRQLEGATGTALFRRTTRSVALTPSGRRLYQEVATAVDAIDRALHRGSGPSPEKVTVAYVGAAADDLIPAVAWSWDRPGGVDLQLLPASSASQLTSIEAGAVDVGVQWVGPRSGDFEVTRLLTEPIRVALAATHPLAGTDAIELAELAEETWLMAADRSDLVVRTGLAEACARHGFVPRIRDAATGHPAQVHLVAAGRGVCLVPKQALGHQGAPVWFVQIARESIDLVAVTRPAPSTAVRQLVDLLATTCGRVRSSGP